MKNKTKRLTFTDPTIKTLAPSKLLPTVPIINGYSVKLVPVNDDNQLLLYQWRNQANVRQYMINQQVISRAEHQLWFSGLAKRQDQQHFVIYYQELPIGAINISCHDGLALEKSQHGEVGLYIGEEKYRQNILAFAPSLAINDYAFEQLGIKKLSSKVKADNSAALKYNQQLGYTLTSKNSQQNRHQSETEFLAISLSAKDYETKSQSLKQFLARGNKRVNE